MYSLEQRTAAVQLFIKSGLNENEVIHKLGYPSPNTLRGWYREYQTTGTLHSTSLPKPRYTDQQKKYAVEYFARHKLSLKQTCRSLGYPTRGLLRRWIMEESPELLRRKASSCTQKKNLLRYSKEEKQAAVESMIVNGIPDYKVAVQYGVSKATINNWKQQLLGKDVVTAMPKKPAQAPSNGFTAELQAEISNLQKEVMHLQMERDALKKTVEILKKATGINLVDLKNPEKAEVIDALRNKYRLCDLLSLFQISKSSYFYSRQAIRKDKYNVVRSKIKGIFDDNACRYGYRRIHICLKKRGIRLSEKVVRRIMKEENLVVISRSRKKYSSYKGEITPAVPNVVQRDFHAAVPNRKWLTDLTEFAIPAGKVYLSAMIDCFDGMVQSWTIGISPNANLVNQMLDQAVSKLKPEEHPIIHSDRGSHYRWPEWISKVNAAGLVRSMSKKGCSPDNSACEGFFGRLKNEFFYGRSWENVSLKQFMDMLNQYIHWYNEKRIKVSLGGKSPLEYRRSLGLA